MGAIQKSYIKQNAVTTVQQPPNRQLGKHTGFAPTFDAQYTGRGGPVCPPFCLDQPV